MYLFIIPGGCHLASGKFGENSADSNSLSQAKKDNIALADITGRKRPDDVLHMMQFAVDHAAEAVFWTDIEGGIYYVNDTACGFLGYAKDELLSMNMKDIDPSYGSLRSPGPDEDVETIVGTGVRTIESVYRRKDGTGFPVEITANIITFDGQQRYCSYVRDISARRQAEAALRGSEEKYRLLAETAPDMIYIIGNDFRVKYVNRAAAGALGDAPGNMRGKPLEALFPEETAREMKEGLRQVMDSGKPLTGEMVHRFPGMTILMHVILTPLFDSNGKANGVMGISRDITDRKKAEEALLESERTKMALMDGIPESLLLLDRNGIILDANSVLARMLRKSKEELIGAYAYDFIDPAAALLRKSKIDEVFLTGRPVSFEDVRAGTYFENIVNPVLAKDGKVEKVAIIAIDITERKRAEAALHDAKAQAELYLDLLGHDINNMHQIALGYLELAREKHPEVRHQEYLDKPIEVLYRSARLIKNVRKLQKLRDDALGSGIVDLAGVLRDVQREYREATGKTVTLDLDGNEQCPVYANELLYDVFANLVSNAVNHTGDGTTIAIVLQTKEENGSRYCNVSVEDNGPGIPDDLKGKIFNRLLRGTSRAKGMGLGLYLVKSLVESYNGRVWVEDRVPGDYTQGAKFVVMLPVAGP